MSKYGNKKVQIGDRVFDSLKEGRRYSELMMLDKAGYITDLECQKKFVLIPRQTDEHGKVIERECTYRADFYYIDTDTGKEVVEDVKGMRTEVYKIKKKLLLHVHGLRIKEI